MNGVMKPLARLAATLILSTIAAPASAQPFPFSEAVRVDDILYLSGQIGVAPGSTSLMAGGLPAETRQTMDNIGNTLRKHGLGYGDLVKCTVMLTDMARWSEFNRVYAAYFEDGKFPARSAFGVTALALGAQVEIECLARFPKRSQAFNPTPPLGPYSQMIRTGSTVYTSGIIAYDATAKRFASAEIKSQMGQVLANLDTLLAAADLDKSQIVKTTLFLRDPMDMPAANEAYAAYFSVDPQPARTTVPGGDWGRPEILVELEAIARAGH